MAFNIAAFQKKHGFRTHGSHPAEATVHRPVATPQPAAEPTRVENSQAMRLVTQIVEAAPPAPRHLCLEEILELAKADSKAGVLGITGNSCDSVAYIHINAPGTDVLLVVRKGSPVAEGHNFLTGEVKKEPLEDDAETMMTLTGILIALRATAGPKVESQAEWGARMASERAQRDAEWAEGFAAWRADVERRNQEFRRNFR